MKIQAEWSGADEFVDGMQAVVRRQPAFIKYEALTAANTIASDFRPKVPVDTGRAQRSINVAQVDNDAQLSAGVGVPYWEFLDFGGSTGKGHKPRRGGSGSVKRKYGGKQGRFYWRSLDNRYEDVVDAAGARLVALMRRSRLVVTVHGNPQRRGS